MGVASRSRHAPCSAEAIGPRRKKLGNLTDEWVWCADHGGVPPEVHPEDRHPDLGEPQWAEREPEEDAR